MKVRCLILALLNSGAATSALQFPFVFSPGSILSWARNAITSTGPVSSSQAELLDFHRKLVDIESVTGNELEVGNYLVTYLEAKNFTVERQPVSADRFNVLAYMGTQRQTRILLTSHMDTDFIKLLMLFPLPAGLMAWTYIYNKVPPHIPYSTHRTDNSIWGRGTVDAKACIAAQTAAVADLFQSGAIDPSSVSLLFVVGEETGGDGMRAVNKLGLTWESVIFGEPTEQKLVSGHKGMLGFSLSVTGKAAHSGYPWLGVSATRLLLEALNEVETLVGKMPVSDKYGETTLNIGRLDGGVAANVVAERASADLLMRLAVGTPAELRSEILLALEGNRKAAEKAGGKLDVKWSGQAYPPVDIDHDVPGFGSHTVNYGTDIPNLEGTHKRYLYGPGSILVAHSDHEHLSVQELEQAVTDYKKLVLATLKKDPQ